VISALPTTSLCLGWTSTPRVLRLRSQRAYLVGSYGSYQPVRRPFLGSVPLSADFCAEFCTCVWTDETHRIIVTLPRIQHQAVLCSLAIKHMQPTQFNHPLPKINLSCASCGFNIRIDQLSINQLHTNEVNIPLPHTILLFRVSINISIKILLLD